LLVEVEQSIFGRTPDQISNFDQPLRHCESRSRRSLRLSDSGIALVIAEA
jgi:hypothetical protein